MRHSLDPLERAAVVVLVACLLALAAHVCAFGRIPQVYDDGATALAVWRP